MSTTAYLQVRLPLHREAPGSWLTEDGSVQVLRLRRHHWIIRANGEPVKVMGRGEFTGLREAHGLLADTRDVLRERMNTSNERSTR